MAYGRPVTPQAAQAEITRRAVHQSFGAFFRASEPTTPYCYGRHTVATMALVDDLLTSFEAGRSRYVRIEMPFRHGKSDLVSRRMLPYFLLRYPEKECILASYNYELATELADDARRCFRRWADEFKTGIVDTRDRVASWRTAEGGAMFAAGLNGTVTGRGAHLLAIDDYLKSRADAESDAVTEHLWASFRSDLMTRLAPVHICIIMANRWGMRDLAGRIERMNDPTSNEYDPAFPVFEVYRFPAETDTGWLFPERFSPEWYQSMKAMLGEYAWQAQAQQNPMARTGSMLRADLARAVANVIVEAGPAVSWRWGIDLASTAAERGGDPDYTVATLEAYDKTKMRLYVRDVFRTRAGALERDKALEARIMASGCSRVIVEAIGGYKDAYAYLRERLRGRATVAPCSPSRDKVARASYLEPIFEAGNVIIQAAEWNAEWRRQVAGFPGLPHDDEVDSMVVGVYREFAGGGALGLAA